MFSLEPEVSFFLRGEKFSNKLPVKIAGKNKLISRIDLICDLVKDKKVLHLGCVDHLPLIQEKIRNNTWLYKRIEEKAALQSGIDTAVDGVEYMRNNLGYPNVHCVDIMKEAIPPAIQQVRWDYLIMGELLEHIDDPVAFLKQLHQRFSGNVDKLLITVPNALSAKNFVYALRNKECINTDHRYWFTPFTLHKIVHLSGYQKIEHDFASYFPLSSGKPVRNFFLRKLFESYPPLRSNLVCTAKF